MVQTLIIVVLLRSLQNKSHRGQPGGFEEEEVGEEERKAGLSSEKEQPLGGRFVSIWPLRCAEKQRKVALRVF